MKLPMPPTERASRRNIQPAVPVLSLLAICFLLLALTMSAGGASSSAQAAPQRQVSQPVTGTVAPIETAPAEQPAATDVPSNPSDEAPPGQEAQPGGATQAPPGVGTAVVINPVRTSTTGEPVVPQPPPSAVTNNPGSQPSGGNQDSGFPWLPVALVGLAALVGVGFVLMRGRGPAPAVAATGTAARVREHEREVGSTTVTTVESDTTRALPPLAVTTATTAPVAAAAAAPAAPTEITCPNCSTVNSIDENFCHECGEDLRATRAAALAALPAAVGPVADVDIDTLPYLETLDRSDEQLEYVLSRPRVLIGTAPGNDIVINEDFKGYRTVSPVHAELRQETEGYLLRDRDSQHGTFVNGGRTGESILADGDTFSVGDVRFVFHVPEK